MPEPFDQLGLRAWTKLAPIKDVDVAGSELIEHHVAARVGERLELLRERPVLAVGGIGNRSLTGGEKGVAGLLDGDPWRARCRSGIREGRCDLAVP